MSVSMASLGWQQHKIIKNNHDLFAICYAMCAFENQVMDPQIRKGASRARPRQYPHGNPHNHL